MKIRFLSKFIHNIKIDNFAGSNLTSLSDLNGLFHSNYLDDLISYFHLVENDILVLNESRILKVIDFCNVRFILCKFN